MLIRTGKPRPWSAFGTSAQVAPNVLSDTCTQRLSQWIEDCITNHSSCKSLTQSARPARLLKVELLTDTADPTVILISVDQEDDYKYVALSHYWARSKPIKTTSLNVHERSAGIQWGDLPEVFQDTVRLSLRLGIRYIWIDSLCIIQGDETDWLAESPKMRAIYQDAYVVFAAHGHTLALEKEEKRCTFEGITDSIASFSDTDVMVRQSIDHDNFVNPADDTDSWFGRAWCFQERLFSSRILHFGGAQEEIWFECNEHACCECGGMAHVTQDGADSTWSHPKTRFARALKKSEALQSEERMQLVWRTYSALCETFTSQGLTHPADTLVAFSSLIERLSPYLGEYFAGLWKHNILVGLQWESVDGRKSQRHPSYVAPSFSWASRSGPIVWYVSDEYLTPNREKCTFAEVLDIRCESTLGSSFGRYLSGYIKLRGYITTMRFEDIPGCYSLGRLKIFKETASDATKDRKSRSIIQKVSNRSKKVDKTSESYERQQRRQREEDCCWVCMDAVEDMLEARAKTVTCLDIMRDKVPLGSRAYISALVLWSVPGGAGHFRRIGFSTMTPQFFRGAELADVTIV